MEGEIIFSSSHHVFVKCFWYTSLALMITRTFGYFCNNLVMWIFCIGSVNHSLKGTGQPVLLCLLICFCTLYVMCYPKSESSGPLTPLRFLQQ